MTALLLLKCQYGLADVEFYGIQNGTRHSGSLIKWYRKAILSKVTCVALHQETVMSILTPKQRRTGNPRSSLLLFIRHHRGENIHLSVKEREKERKTESRRRHLVNMHKIKLHTLWCICLKQYKNISSKFTIFSIPFILSRQQEHKNSQSEMSLRLFTE